MQWENQVTLLFHLSILPKSTSYRISSHLSLCIKFKPLVVAELTTRKGVFGQVRSCQSLEDLLGPLIRFPDFSSVKCLAVSMIEISTAVIYHDPELTHRSQLCNFR